MNMQKRTSAVLQNQSIVTLVRWCIYFVPFVPLIIFQQFFSPFHFGKVVVFRTLIELIALPYLWLILTDRRWLPPRTRLFWAVTGFTAVFGLTTLTSFHQYLSFMGSLERMGGWFTFVHFWLFYVMATGIFRTREEWMRLIHCSLIAGVISAFYGLLQRTDLALVLGGGGRSRIFGTIGNTALFAGYQIINLFLALGLLVREPRGSGTRWTYGIITLLLLIVVMMTGVRGAVLGIVVSAIILFFIYPFGVAARRVRWALGIILGLAIIAEVFLIVNHDTLSIVKKSGYISRISDISFETRTVDTRLWAWQAGIRGWLDNARTIIFGWGPENFDAPFTEHFNPKFFIGYGSETLFDRAHNMFIEVLVTMGVVGLAAYLWLFISLIRELFLLYQRQQHEYKAIAAVLFCGLIAYAIHNSFIFDTSANFIAFFIFIGLVTWLVRETSPEPIVVEPQSFNVSPMLRQSAVIVSTIVVIWVFWLTAVTPARANYLATRGLVASWPQNNRNHALAVQNFRKALAYDTFSTYELRNRFAQYLMEQVGNFQANAKPREALQYAVEQEKKNITPDGIASFDYVPYLYMSRMLILLGKDDPKSPYNDQALEIARIAQKLSPKFVRTYYEIAQAYVNKLMYKEAIDTFHEAIQINPEVDISWWYLGLTQIESGDITNGLLALQKGLELGYDASEQDYMRLINYFAQVGDIQKVSQYYTQLLALEPNKGLYHLKYAFVLQSMRRPDEAATEALKALELDPALEPDVQQFLKTIGR